MANDTKTSPSFLQALGVSKHTVELNGQSVTVYGLRNKEAAQLLESFGKLPDSAKGVIKLLNPTSGEEQEYFTTDYGKLGGAAVGWLNELLAVSLRVDVAEVEEIAIEHLPTLLNGIWEANKVFFTDAFRLVATLAERVPAAAALLKGWTGEKPSPPSNAAAGQ